MPRAATFKPGLPTSRFDGYLIDHEPPVRLVIALAEDGIHWQAGETLRLLDPATGAIDLSTIPDEIDLDVESFNSRVITEPFNRTVCAELARHIDPTLPGKTLIFCANDAHADMVVDLLSQSLAARYAGIHHDTVAKITGKSDKPGRLIRRLKNEQLPKIGVTVDLLTTGIDIPAIINKEAVIDRDAFNEGRWRDIGGFDAANRIFDGKLESLLGDLQSEVWRDSA